MGLALTVPVTRNDMAAVAENAHSSAVFLSRIAALLESSRFAKYIEANASRFDWATPAVQDKLRKDLFFQVRQGCNIRISDQATVSQMLATTAAMCDAEVRRLTYSYDLKLRKKDRSFSVPRQADYETEVLKLLDSRPPAPSIKDMGRPFYLWNSVDSLVTYVRARRTLSTHTGHEKLESLLDRLSEQYMLDGYPHDILVHDVASVTSGSRNVAGLLVRKEWCSSWVVTEDDKGQESRDGFEFVPMR